VRIDNEQFSSDHIVVGKTITISAELRSLVNREVTVKLLLPAIDANKVKGIIGDNSGCYNNVLLPAAAANDIVATPEWKLVGANFSSGSIDGIALPPGGNATFSVQARATQPGVFRLISGYSYGYISQNGNGIEGKDITLSAGSTVFVTPVGYLSNANDESNQIILKTDPESVTYEEPFYYFGNVSQVRAGEKAVHVTLSNSSGYQFQRYDLNVEPDGFYSGFARLSDLADQNFTITAQYAGKEAKTRISYTPGLVGEYEICEKQCSDTTRSMIVLATEGISARHFSIHEDRSMIGLSINSTKEGVMEVSMPNDMIRDISAINATIYSAEGNFSRTVDWKVMDNTLYPEANPVIRIRVPPNAYEMNLIGSLINPSDSTLPEIWSLSSLSSSLIFPIGLGVAIASMVAFLKLRGKRK
jgi:hypothetical protein